MSRLGAVLALSAVLVAAAGCAANPQRDISDEAREEASRTNTQLGVRYLRNDDLQQALRKLQKAVAQDSGNASAHMVMGVVYERLDETAKARDHFRRSLRIDPENSSALNNYGRFLCEQGDHDEAFRLLERAVDNPLYGSPEKPLANAGLCAWELDDHERAEEYFLRALRSNPRFPVALRHMAEIRLADGNAMDAKGYYQRYLEVTRQTAESLWLGIRIASELGDEDDLASYSLALRERFPDSPQTSRLLEWERDGKL